MSVEKESEQIDRDKRRWRTHKVWGINEKPKGLRPKPPVAPPKIHFEIIPTGYSTISEKYKWEEYPKEIPDTDFNKIPFDVTGDVEKHVVWHAQGIPDTW